MISLAAVPDQMTDKIVESLANIVIRVEKSFFSPEEILELIIESEVKVINTPDTYYVAATVKHWRSLILRQCSNSRHRQFFSAVALVILKSNSTFMVGYEPMRGRDGSLTWVQQT